MIWTGVAGAPPLVLLGWANLRLSRFRATAGGSDADKQANGNWGLVVRRVRWQGKANMTSAGHGMLRYPRYGRKTESRRAQELLQPQYMPTRLDVHACTHAHLLRLPRRTISSSTVDASSKQI